MIKIWKYEDAPKKYTKGTCNDDADWVAFVPNKYNKHYIGFLECAQFGCYEIKRIKHRGGRVFIGYHA